ncbi:type I membrane glycoproteins cell-cell fusogen domain-containing protein [Ditylenchus destructor]|uniref:Type I membrane glycoproteins cell-cell fusogen domain-containing protein n=1 Tax=Ditylenchus destructor TaxID=166010 RepID=A0AAD4NEE0_9BILA|nr:type I membrane glycoproteins cell-cell fusogen domain-containing protein [Ditylenchus destructor]
MSLPLGRNVNSIQSASLFSSSEFVELPHCSKAIVTVSHTSRLTRRSLSSSEQMSLSIGVGQSVCFRLQHENNSNTSTSSQNIESANLNVLRRKLENRTDKSLHPEMPEALRVAETASTRVSVTPTSEAPQATRNHLLHTLTLVELEQYHAITERYRFALPEVETQCICECNSMAPTCQADEYKYGKCQSAHDPENHIDEPTNEVCYRTFFANQPVNGCASNEKDSSNKSPRLCCQLRFRPKANRTFTAVKLELPTTSAILRYSIYSWQRKPVKLPPSMVKVNVMQAPNSTISSHNETDLMWTDGWVELERRKVRVQLDGTVHNSFLDEQFGLKLSILGMGGKSSPNQLEAGMYFVENVKDMSTYSELRSQPLNRITEHDFHKLGWLRLDEKGRPFVQSGDIFLDKIHHARAENCAEQKYKSVLEASYYITKRGDGANQNSSVMPSMSFQLAEPLNRIHRWIRSARVYDASERQVVITAGEGTNLDITLTTTSVNDAESPSEDRENISKPTLISFVHNSSQLVDFTATILVDRYSNSLLNLSIYGGKGVLNGYVRQLDDWNGEDIDSFSVIVSSISHKTNNISTPYTPNPLTDQNNLQGHIDIDVEKKENSLWGTEAISPSYTLANVVTRIKPYPLNSIQVVCLRPDDTDQNKELCRPVQSIQFDLEMNTVTNEWTDGLGHCADCNRITVEGFMKYLNPANWTKGVNSVSDALMLASDIFGYIFVFLVVYIVLTKILIPLISCLMCPVSLFYSRSKK